MSNGIKTLITFVAGAAAGSAVTWYLVKAKYEQIAQEEIDSVLEVYSKRANTNIKSEEKEDDKKPSLKEESDDMLRNLRYVSDDENEEEGGSEELKHNKPYIINPDEFEYSDDYEQISLTYYADGILADDTSDDVIEDIEGTVGLDFPNHFGEYEEDTVYVKNDRLKCAYEINRDDRGYSDVTGLDPDLTVDDE